MLSAFELTLLDALQGMRTQALDVFFKTVTKLGNGGIFWIVLGVALCVFKKTRRAGLTVLLALLLDLLLCNLMLKPLVARTRPFVLNPDVQLLIPQPGEYSFPSGHTAGSFSAACALLFAREKRVGIPAVVLAAVIAFSRLYLYVHFPTDILGGIAVGVFCGFAGNWVISRFARKVPRLFA